MARSPRRPSARFTGGTALIPPTGGGFSSAGGVNTQDPPAEGGGGGSDISNLRYTPPGPFSLTEYIDTLPTMIPSWDGGGVVLTWQISGGTLPTGITFDNNSGFISGLPTATLADTEFTVTATTANGSATATFNLEVTTLTPPSGLSYAGSPFDILLNSSFSAFPTISGDEPFTYAITPDLPAGLAIDENTGEIFGAPTALSGSQSYTVTATNLKSETTQGSLILGVTNNVDPPTGLTYPTPNTATLGLAFSIAPTVTGGDPPLNFGVALTSEDQLPAGLSLDPQTGVISGVPTSLTSFADVTIEVGNDGGSVFFTLQIEVVDQKVLTLEYAGITATSDALVLKVGDAFTESPTTTGGTPTLYTYVGVLPAGVTLNPTNGVFSGTPQPGSEQDAAAVTIYAGNGSNTENGGLGVGFPFTLEVQDQGPTTITYSPDTFSLEETTDSIDVTPTVTGGNLNLVYTVSPDLPAGLSLNASTGQITGTPTPAAVQGATPHVVTATNEGGSAADTVTITVTVRAPAFTYGDPYVFVNGTDIGTISPAETGGAVATWADTDGLEAATGLTFDTGTGVLTGTPTTTGIAPVDYTITGTNATGAGTHELTITVNPEKPATVEWNGGATWTITHNEAVTPISPVLTGGTELLSYSGTLPPGLALNESTGEITGTPTQIAGATEYTLTATNITGSASDTLTIVVQVQDPGTLTYSPNPASYVQAAGTQQIVPNTTGGDPTGYTNVGIAFPPEITLDPTFGVLTVDTTNLLTNATYTIRASNGTGFDDETVDIEVVGAPSSGPTNLMYSPSVATFEVGRATSLDGGPMVPSWDGGDPVGFAVTAGTLPNANIPAITLPAITPKVSPVSSDFSNVDYTPAEQTVAATGNAENMSIFLPTGTAPAGGWPCVMVLRGAAFVGLPSQETLTAGTPIQDLQIAFLDAGIAVASVGLASSGDAVGGQFFSPPGDPNGRWEDPNYTFHEKSAVKAIQYLKKNGFATHTVDPQRLFLLASSSGNAAAFFAAMGPDRANWATGAVAADSEITYSTSVRGIFAYDAVSSFPAFLNSTTIGAQHWEDADPPGNEAATYGDADPAHLQAASSSDFIRFEKSLAYRTPVFIVSDEITTETNYTFDANEFPALRNTLGAQVHDVWHGAVLADQLFLREGPTVHGAKSVFAAVGGVESGLPVAQQALVTNTYAAGDIYTQTQTDAVAWAVARAEELVANPDGLQLHEHSGYIFGKPDTAAAQANYTITATNPSGSDAEPVTITVNVQRPSNVEYEGGSNAIVFTKDSAGSSVPTFDGAPSGWSLLSGSLPPNVTLNATTGEIAGTPTATFPSTNITVQASNVSGSDSVSGTIRVRDAAPSTVDWGGPHTFAVNVAVDITPIVTGGTPTSWVEVDTLPAGLSLDVNGHIVGTPTTPSGATNYDLKGVNETGEATDTVNITVTASTVTLTGYTPDRLDGNHSLNNYGPPVSTTLSPTLVPTFTGNPTFTITDVATGLLNFTTETGLSIDSGTGVISGTTNGTRSDKVQWRVTADDGVSSDTFDLYIGVTDAVPGQPNYTASPTVNTLVFDEGTVGSYFPDDSVDEYGWRFTAVVGGGDATDGTFLGITFKSLTGEITGQPTADLANPVLFDVYAGNGVGESVARRVSLVLNPAAPTSITYAGDPYTAIVGTPFTATPVLVGEKVTITINPQLPTGLDIDAATGTISGTPQVIDPDTEYTVHVENVTGSIDQTVNLQVTDGIPSNISYSPDRFPATEASGDYRFTVGQQIPTLTPVGSDIALVDDWQITPDLPGASNLASIDQPDTIFPVNAVPIDFAPTERKATGARKPSHTANVFLPPGLPPSDGWPVVVVASWTGEEAATPHSVLNRSSNSTTGVAREVGQVVPISAQPVSVSGSGTGALWEFVQRGYAVVSVGGMRTSNSSGLFFEKDDPVGIAELGVNRWASFEPEYDNNWKAYLWAVQWAKTQTSYNLDTAQLFAMGERDAGAVAAWVCGGPELAAGSGSAQVQASSKAKALMLVDPVVYPQAYEGDSTLFGFQSFALEQAAEEGTSIETGWKDANATTAAAISAYDALFGEAAERTTTAALPLFVMTTQLVTESTPGDPKDITFTGSGPSAGDPPTLSDDGDVVRYDGWHSAILSQAVRDLSGASEAFHFTGGASVFAWATAVSSALDPSYSTLYTTSFAGDYIDKLATLGGNWLDATVTGGGGVLGAGSGLTFDTLTGTISGTPTVDQTQTTHTISAINTGVGQQDIPINLTVEAASESNGYTRLGMNVANYGSNFRGTPFNDLIHQSSSFRTVNATTGNLEAARAVVFDSDHATAPRWPDPVANTKMTGLFIAGGQVTGDLPAGTAGTPYVMTYRGDVSVQAAGAAITETSRVENRAGISRVEFTINTATLGTSSFSVKETSRGTGVASNPWRDCHIWLPGTEPTASAGSCGLTGNCIDSEHILNDAFFESMSQMNGGKGPDHLRTMNWANVNTYGQSTSGSRYFYWKPEGGNRINPVNSANWGYASEGVPMEVCVAAANKLDCDLYVTIPARSRILPSGTRQDLTDQEWADFIADLMGAVKDGVTHEYFGEYGIVWSGLNKHRTCYVELSNELWNNFPAATWMQSLANAAGVTREEIVAQEWIKMVDAVDALYGKNNPRIRFVVNGQQSNPNFLANVLANIPSTYRIDFVGIAPYMREDKVDRDSWNFEYDPGVNPSPQEILDSAQKSIDGTGSTGQSIVTNMQAALATANGRPNPDGSYPRLLNYEGLYSVLSYSPGGGKYLWDGEHADALYIAGMYDLCRNWIQAHIDVGAYGVAVFAFLRENVNEARDATAASGPFGCLDGDYELTLTQTSHAVPYVLGTVPRADAIWRGVDPQSISAEPEPPAPNWGTDIDVTLAPINPYEENQGFDPAVASFDRGDCRFELRPDRVVDLVTGMQYRSNLYGFNSGTINLLARAFNLVNAHKAQNDAWNEKTWVRVNGDIYSTTGEVDIGGGSSGQKANRIEWSSSMNFPANEAQMNKDSVTGAPSNGSLAVPIHNVGFVGRDPDVDILPSMFLYDSVISTYYGGGEVYFVKCGHEVSAGQDRPFGGAFGSSWPGTLHVYDGRFKGDRAQKDMPGGAFGGFGIKFGTRMTTRCGLDYRRVDCDEAQEHFCYTNDLVRDSYFVANTHGGSANTKYQITVRPAENPGTHGKCVIVFQDDIAVGVAEPPGGNSGGAYTIVGHEGTVVFRNCGHKAGQQNFDGDMHRSILVWEADSPSLGSGYNSRGYHTAHVVINGFLYDPFFGANYCNNRASSLIQITGAELIDIFDFDLTLLADSTVQLELDVDLNLDITTQDPPGGSSNQTSGTRRAQNGRTRLWMTGDATPSAFSGWSTDPSAGAKLRIGQQNGTLVVQTNGQIDALAAYES